MAGFVGIRSPVALPRTTLNHEPRAKVSRRALHGIFRITANEVR